MNKKYCIFNEKKVCDNCDVCNKCDLNSNKKCNNCGQCLELEGYDMRAVKIDTILEEEELEEYEVRQTEIADCCHTDAYIEDDEVEFIDDIDGLREILENKEKFKRIVHEEYPGFIKITENIK